jgi:hypothetical protein
MQFPFNQRPRLRPPVALLAAFAAVLSIAGCRDITNPATIPVESIQASYTPDYSRETPEVTMTVPGYSGTGMLYSASAPKIKVAHHTAVELTFYSSVTGVSSTGSTTSFGVRGSTCPYSNNGVLQFGSASGILNLCVFAPAGTAQLAITVVDTFAVRDSVALSRNSHPSTMTWSASPATVRIRPVDVDLGVRGKSYLGSTVVSLDESTMLLSGSGIQLEVYNVPEVVKVRTGLWVQTGGIRFQPDSGAAKTCTPSNDVGGKALTTCVMTGIDRSGTLTVDALVNGKWKKKELKVIRKQNFVLTPDSSSAFVDDSIRFTATMDGHEVPVEQWRWKGPIEPDTTHECTSGGPTCDQKLVFIGPGTMTAYLADSDSASATVTAQDTVPCPTGDPIIDNRAFRAGFDSAWSLSNPNTLPFYNRVETQMLLYMQGRQVRSYVPTPNPPTDSACVNQPVGRETYPGTFIGRGHVHPSRKNDTIECQPGKKGQYKYTYGGPSAADWRSVTGAGGCQYIVDAQNIIRYCALPTSPADGMSDNYWTWKGHPNGAGEHLPRPNKLKPFTTVYPRKVGSCVRL